MLKVAVVGATGYTGKELLEILVRHPFARPVYLTSESSAGLRIDQVYPQFRSVLELQLHKMEETDPLAQCDFIFSALPHGLSMDAVPKLLATGKKVVDLSGDFRLKDSTLYPRWYGYEHRQENWLAGSVYGLPEFHRAAIRGAKLVANPGCYPTSVLLPLKPLLSEGVIDPADIIVDSKSGVSGAGRSPKLPFHFPECTENFKAYKVAEHQHTPEIEQELSGVCGQQMAITFTPHLVPMVRGILSTIYLRVKGGIDEGTLWEIYEKHYGSEPFIRFNKPPELPETKFVSGSNFCDISFRLDRRTNRLIVVSAIDNLIKGAAGQAIQNMNIMQGLPEDAGLK
ncbi:MAG: N-acetyl-gamma-glutamyl-phosphate reductase [Dethiobacter sp.]|nr:N-acetyl-gamma-glutamyl-phosphate reductase [Dethiobacter sp.]